MPPQQKGGPQSSGGGRGGGGANKNAAATGTALLSVRYPVNSTWEFTLPNDEVMQGTVYCTDEISQTVVLQKSLVHTTLAFEVRMVQAASIKKEKLVSSSTENSANSDSTMSTPLPVVQKKVLEEREKRALKLAEEGFKHINQNVRTKQTKINDMSPYGGIGWRLYTYSCCDMIVSLHLFKFFSSETGFTRRSGRL
mgnify:CR=1 FL=1